MIILNSIVYAADIASRSMEQHGSKMDKSYCYHGNGNTIIKVPVEQAMESVH